MLAALDTIAPREVRCGIIFDGEQAPLWAEACIEQLRNRCGRKNLFFISTDRGSLKEQIGSLYLDFALNLNSTESMDWIRFLPHGAWSFRFGESRQDSGDNFGSQELWGNQVVQTVRLESISPDGVVSVLKEGKFRSVLYSLAKHRIAVLTQCADWPAQLVQELIDSGSIQGSLEVGLGVRNSLESKKSPASLALAAITFFRWCFHLLGLSKRFFLYSQWNIGMVREGLPALLENSERLAVDWLLELKWPLFYADPFLTSYQGQNFVFAERYDFRKGKGAIAVLPLTGAPYDEKRDVALEFPFHTSYPCLIKDSERLYCVPETLARKEIAIYRCEKFPRVWQKVTVVAEGSRYSDPTIFHHGGRWWVFATIFDEHSEGNSILHAWHAPRLAGPWTAHLKNPIKCDVSGSRSAGNLFFMNGELFRPAQDCSRSYGHSLVIQKVVNLTPESFEERLVHTIGPTAEYPDGCHHMTSMDGMVFIDGRRERPSVAAMWFRTKRIGTTIGSRLFKQPETALRPFPLRLETTIGSASVGPASI